MEPGVLPHNPCSGRRDGRLRVEEPFASLLGSRKGSMVDPRGHYSNSLEDLQALLRDCESLGDKVAR